MRGLIFAHFTMYFKKPAGLQLKDIFRLSIFIHSFTHFMGKAKHSLSISGNSLEAGVKDGHL